MRRTGSGLFRRTGVVARICRCINQIAAGLVFRGVSRECAHNRNEISAFAAELVFREIPGELVQGRGDPKRLRLCCLIVVALVDSVCGGVAGVLLAPDCLGFLAPGGLAVRVTAGSLTIAYSRIRIEPPQADPAGALPGSGHAPSSHSSQVVNFSRAEVVNFWRAPKSMLMLSESRFPTTG